MNIMSPRLNSSANSSFLFRYFLLHAITMSIWNIFPSRGSKKSMEGTDKVISLIEKLDIDYVIAGDYHGYAKIEIGNTV